MFGEGSIGRLDDCQHHKTEVAVGAHFAGLPLRFLCYIMIPAMATWTYPGARLGLLGLISQITDEPRFKGADRQEIFGLISKIIEPVLGHSAADDLPFEALVVNLKKGENSREHLGDCDEEE